MMANYRRKCNSHIHVHTHSIVYTPTYGWCFAAEK